MNSNHVVILGGGTAGLIAALMIREKYPFVNITIIRSSEIGIIGVGEGSTEHWDLFMRFVNINHLELINETDATIKIGILFKEWNKGEQYVHSVGYHNHSSLNRPELFNNLFLFNNSKYPLSPEFDFAYSKNNVILSSNLKASNQYHFDTFKLNNFLVKLCNNRSIVIKEGNVSDVNINENGYVTSLVLEKDMPIDGDIFIDCSGFKRVISSKIGTEWVSYSNFLPMNNSIAFPTEFDDPEQIEPYTTSTALSSGWVWKIPTQNRYGNGYVFCDKFIDSDNALNEVSQHLEKNIEKAARQIKFEAGRVSAFWKNNVINIGLAGSFAEPLEAQSIGFSIIQCFSLIDYLDTWQFNKNVSNNYNAKMTEAFDNIVDYLQLHYFTTREDSLFWKEKPYIVTASNKNLVELLDNGIIDPTVFNYDASHLMFRTVNFYQVAAGLGLLKKETVLSTLKRNREKYNFKNSEETKKIVDSVYRDTLVCNHRKFLDLVKFNFNIKNEN